MRLIFQHPLRLKRLLRLAGFVAFVTGPSLQAEVLTWDADADFATGATDGAGVWDTAGLRWRAAAANVIWDNANADIARFGSGGAGATVTLSGALTAGGLEFAPLSSGAYTLTGGTLTLTPDAAIRVDATSAAIASAVSSTGTITKTGAGALTLSGTNTLAGLEVAQGTVNIAGTGAAGDSATVLALRRLAESSSNIALNFAVAGTFGQGLVVAASGTGESTLANTAAGTVTLTGPVSLEASAILSTTNATRTMTLSGLVSGAGGVTKRGAGIVSLTGVANTFTGAVSVEAGNLRVARLANGGVASSLGASSSAASNLTLNGGTIGYITGASVSTDRLFTLGSLGGGIDQSAASGSTLTFANTGDIAMSGTGTRTLTLSGTRAGVLASRLADPSGGLLNLTKSGTGTWTLTNAANSHAGTLRVNAGTLQFSTVSNGGAGSAMGLGAAAPSGIVVAGTVSAPAYWGYSGTVAASTDRLFTLGVSTAGAAGGVANNASAAASTLTLANTGAIAYGTANQTRTLTLGGTNTGTNTFSPLVQNNGTALVNLTKAGAGRWILTNANTHTGVTTLSGGTLQVGSLTDGGVASPLGAASAAAANLVFSGASTLAYTGAGASTNRAFTLATTSSVTLNSNGTGALTLTAPALAYGTANQARTLQLGGTNTGANTFNPILQDNGTGKLSFLKIGAGRWILPNANTYTGVTTLSGGTLQVSSLADGGVASSIGAAGSAASNLVFSGTSTLSYDGAGASSNRAFTLGTTASVTLANNGTGALILTAPAPAYGTVNQARSLTLGGTYAGASTFAAALANNGTGITSLNKTGTTTWILTGASTHTGTTAVSAGSLFNNGSASASAHTVASSATLGGSGTTGAITLASGASLSPGAAGAASTGTLTAASLNWAGGATLRFDLENGGVSDRLSLSGALTKSGSGAYAFDFLNTGSTGTYTLISGAALTSGFTSADFSYANLSAGLTGYFDFNPLAGLSFTVVPEPSTFALAGAGLSLALAAARRRRR